MNTLFESPHGEEHLLETCHPNRAVQFFSASRWRPSNVNSPASSLFPSAFWLLVASCRLRCSRFRQSFDTPHAGPTPQQLEKTCEWVEDVNSNFQVFKVAFIKNTLTFFATSPVSIPTQMLRNWAGSSRLWYLLPRNTAVLRPLV